MTARPWEPGVNSAACDTQYIAGNFWVTSNQLLYGQHAPPRAPAGHKAPHKDCECGLYAWRRIKPEWRTGDGEMLAPYMPAVVGAVAFWGDVRVHREGFRAEKACIVALGYRHTRPEVAAVIERVAARYRAEAVPIDELEIAASRYGTPLPDSLQPPTPKPVFYDASYQWLQSNVYYASSSGNGNPYTIVTPPGGP
jgi:hypothetical protein